MKGWILYKKNKNQLTEDDHAINRLLETAAKKQITLEVY